MTFNVPCQGMDEWNLHVRTSCELLCDHKLMKALVDLTRIKSNEEGVLTIIMTECNPEMAYQEILRWMYDNASGKQVTATYIPRGKVATQRGTSLLTGLQSD